MKNSKTIVCAALLVAAMSTTAFGKSGLISTTKSGLISTTKTGLISTTKSGLISTTKTGLISTTRTEPNSTSPSDINVDQLSLFQLLLTTLFIW